MSQDFAKVLVKDDRLMCSDSVKYAVIKGGANMTCARFNAIGGGAATSVINWNIQVPSQETVISRNVLIRTTLAFTIAATTTAYDATIPGSGYVFNYGGIDGFGPFPFHQLVNSAQWTINNNTVSQNTRDILSVLCRIHDKRQLQRYNGMTPTMYDVLGDYTHIAGSNLNPFASLANASYDNDLLPRGAYPVTIAGANPNYAAGASARSITVTIDVCEPVLVSPWTFAGDDSQGMYGLQNLSAIYNLSSGDTASCVRFGGDLAARFTALPVVTFNGASNSQLLFQFLTPHPSDLMPSRNVVPYYEMPRYLSTTVPAIAAGASATVISSSIQLSQIPDKLYITVGLPISASPTGRDYTCADAWMTITGVSINWNNTSGLLSSATQQDLWRMSVENGVNQSWLEFSGKANGVPTGVAGVGVSSLPTCGSVLCLEFAKDIELRDDYYAPGSLGNFQLQFQVSVTNNSSKNYDANVLQLMVITQNGGVFSLERGVASSYLGVLTKSDVLEASRQKPDGFSDALRMVGGGSGKVGDFFKRLSSTLGQAAVKHGLPMLVNAAKAKLGAGKKTNMGSMEDRIY